MKIQFMKLVLPSVVAVATSVAGANPIPSKDTPTTTGTTGTTTTTGTAPSTGAEATTTAAVPAAPAAAELTVEGTIKKLVAKKKEIYVMPSGSGPKKMEFYFPDQAQFFKAGQSVGFDALKEGQKVKVTYTKTGKRLNPSKVEIQE